VIATRAAGRHRLEKPALYLERLSWQPRAIRAHPRFDVVAGEDVGDHRERRRAGGDDVGCALEGDAATTS